VELLSIVVPVYNEESTVRSVIDRLLEIELPIAREILIINDGSTDGTRAVLDGIPEVSEMVRIFHAPINAGKGRAVRTGFEHARGTIVAIQDADLELDPAQLADLIGPILAFETLVVYGSRFLSGTPAAPWLTIVANKVLTGATNLLYGTSITDMETCYKIMRTEVARGLDLQANGFDIEPEITAKVLRQGLIIVERPIRFEPRSRAQGKKIGWRDGMRALEVLVRHRIQR
jgi:glycosyltransferase involved in cell wall biosynthesis